MQRLTMVAPAPGEDPMLGWPDESWDEYATASVEHIDLHPRKRGIALMIGYAASGAFVRIPYWKWRTRQLARRVERRQAARGRSR